MDADKFRLLQQCCRTCLSSHFVQFNDIFTKNENNLSIADLLISNAALKIDEKDMDLPRIICRECYNCLVNFDNFKKKAIEIDTKLKNCIIDGLKDNKLLNMHLSDIKTEIISCDSNLEYYSDDKKNVKDFLNCQYENNNEDDAKSYILQYENDKFLNLSDNRSQSYKENKTIACDICKEVFNKKSILKTHLQKCHELQLVNSDGNHNTHKSEAEIQPHNCKYCKTTFSNIKALSAHMRKHVNIRNLTCQKCSKTFKKTSHLKRHEIVHENKFKCRYCIKIFMEENEYNSHMLQHSETNLKCPICFKKFQSKINLNTHIRIHSTDPKHLCQSCGKSFYSKGNLMQHVKRHNGEKDFCCQYCPDRFISKGELNFHMVVHTKEKRYSCNQCGAKFTRLTSLTQHLKKHLHVKPFKCDTCLLSFATKNHLQRHERVHTGEKPYKCTICGSAYAQACDLLKHKKKHFGDKIYKCTQCEADFKFKTELRDHISEHYLKDLSTAKETVAADNLLSENV